MQDVTFSLYSMSPVPDYKKAVDKGRDVLGETLDCNILFCTAELLSISAEYHYEDPENLQYTFVFKVSGK